MTANLMKGHKNEPKSIYDLKPSKYNPRTISPKQLKRLKKSLVEFGDLSGFVFNVQTGNLVGGHQRLKCIPKYSILRKKKLGKITKLGTIARGSVIVGDEKFPYREVDWPLKKEKLANISANSLGGDFDVIKLKTVVSDLNLTKADVQLANLDNFDLNFEFSPEPEEVKKEKLTEKKSIYELKDTLYFELNQNKYDIPELLPDMFIDIEEKEIRPYVSCEDYSNYSGMFVLNFGKKIPKEMEERTVLVFYRDDYVFEGCWYDTVKFMETKITPYKYKAVVSPNFSLWIEDPITLQIYSIYQSRWVARYWQEAGIKIIPDVNFSDERSFDFCFFGLPKNIPCVSFQVQHILSGTKERNKQEIDNFSRGFEKLIKDVSPGRILFWGEPTKKEWVFELVKNISRSPKLLWCDTWNSIKRKYLPKKGR